MLQNPLSLINNNNINLCQGQVEAPTQNFLTNFWQLVGTRPKSKVSTESLMQEVFSMTAAEQVTKVKFLAGGRNKEEIRGQQPEHTESY